MCTVQITMLVRTELDSAIEEDSVGAHSMHVE